MDIMKANINVVESTEKSVTIQDMGPWDQYKTITNDAENVVEFLIKNKLLSESQQLFYYDSDGYISELVFSDGKFVRFGMCS